MMRSLLFFLLCLVAGAAQAQPSDCAGEVGLAGRSDVVICEQWEASTWWQTRWKNDGRKTSPIAATGPDSTEIVTTGCISGNCLKVNCNAYNNGAGCGGAVAHHLPIPGTRDEVFLRYYIKLASNWTPENICGTAQPSLCGGTPGVPVTSGGKWPGLADTRTSADASGQCGNGGDFSDGINCWSARLKYRDCLGSGGSDICTANAGSEDTTRLGFYWYLPPGTSGTNQTMGAFDNRDWGTQGGDCTTATGQGNAVDNSNTSSNCGIGAAGLKNDVWYRVELHIKMNTPGSNNGVSEAWINGVLKYRKTNVKFRETGHDGLHVRNVWLDVHAGGEGVGPPADTYILLDQLVVTTKGRAGAFKGTGTYVSNPFSVAVNTPSSNGGACNTTGGSTALESAANGVLPGEYCEITTTGMTWAFISSGSENHLEYSSTGVYSPTRKKVRYVGGPHTASMKCMEYDEATNAWSECTGHPSASSGHGYDHHVIDPTRDQEYVRAYASSGTFYRWNGSSWSTIATNGSNDSNFTAGTAWDSTRDGLFSISDRGGVWFWAYNAGTGSWTDFGCPPGWTSCGDETFGDHYLAEFNPSNGLVWFTNKNGGNLHWRLNTNNTFTSLSTPPITLGCCGSSGKMVAYDYRTQKFVVANPYTNNFHQFDIATDTWVDKGTKVALDLGYDTSNVEGFVTAINNYGGVLMYVVARNTGGTPKVFIYKHN